jgi:hypothetical protein
MTLLYFLLKQSKSNKDNYKDTYTIEKFNPPRVSNANVLYTDINGNLGATSDLGLTYLTVSSGTSLLGGCTTDTLNVTSINSPTITNLDTKITNLETKITELETKITNLKTNLETRITTLENNSMKVSTSYTLHGYSNRGVETYYLSDGYTPRSDGLGTNYGNKWFFKLA